MQGGAAQATGEVISVQQLRAMMEQVDPRLVLDPDVEDLLQDLAEDFVDSVTQFSCDLARHRGSSVLDVKDIQLNLERNWGIRVPGLQEAADALDVSSTATALGREREPSYPPVHQKRLEDIERAREEEKTREAQERKAATSSSLLHQASGET